jgi:hypothetical protein
MEIVDQPAVDSERPESLGELLEIDAIVVDVVGSRRWRRPGRLRRLTCSRPREGLRDLERVEDTEATKDTKDNQPRRH